MPRYDDDDFDDDPPRRRSRRRHDDDIRIDIDQSQRIPAGMCGMCLGAFGVHKFILGYGMEGALLLTMSILGIVLGTIGAITGFLCCLPWVLMALYVLPAISGVIGFIEGILYISKTDEDFVETYQIGYRPWF